MIDSVGCQRTGCSSISFEIGAGIQIEQARLDIDHPLVEFEEYRFDLVLELVGQPERLQIAVVL